MSASRRLSKTDVQDHILVDGEDGCMSTGGSAGQGIIHRRHALNATMTIPESHADLLDSLAFWHIATIGPDGAVQSSPVWAGWDGEHLVFSLTKARQKYRNLQANPSIAVSATDPNNSYRYLEIRGTVVRFDDDSSNAFIDSMAKKYMDADSYPFHQPGDERVIVVVKPTHTTQMG